MNTYYIKTKKAEGKEKQTRNIALMLLLTAAIASQNNTIVAALIEGDVRNATNPETDTGLVGTENTGFKSGAGFRHENEAARTSEEPGVLDKLKNKFEDWTSGDRSATHATNDPVRTNNPVRKETRTSAEEPGVLDKLKDWATGNENPSTTKTETEYKQSPNKTYEKNKTEKTYGYGNKSGKWNRPASETESVTKSSTPNAAGYNTGYTTNQNNWWENLKKWWADTTASNTTRSNTTTTRK